MEPIPYYYDNINRNAILVKKKQPFLDWINSVYPDDEPVKMSNEGTIYLISQKEDDAAINSWLKKNFEKIFENELNEWCIDEEYWPKKRTFKQFTDWFAFEIHSMILDIEETMIVK